MLLYHSPSLPPSLSLPLSPSPSPPSLSLGEGDWSNYALWWPDKQVWLSKVRQTLYAYGIMSNAVLEFTSVHRHLIIELPDKSRYYMKVHFAMMTFYVVKEICDTFNIRHAEELSLMKSPFDREGYVKATGYHRSKARAGSREGTPVLEGVDTNTPPGSPGHKNRLPASLDPDAMLPGGGMDSGAVIVRKLGEAPDGSFFSEKLNRSSIEKAFINGL